MAAVKGRQGGFTQTEMLISVSILAVAALVALPNLLGQAERHRLEGAARSIVAELRLAQQ